MNVRTAGKVEMFEHKDDKIFFRKIAKGIILITGIDLPDKTICSDVRLAFLDTLKDREHTIIFCDGDLQIRAILKQLLENCLPADSKAMDKIVMATQAAGLNIPLIDIFAVVAKSYRSSNN